MGQQLLDWWNNGGKTAWGQLVAALGETGKAMQEAASSSPNIGAMQTACTDLQNAVTAVQSAGPVPDPAAEQWLAKSLAEFSTAAADCQAATQALSNGDSASADSMLKSEDTAVNLASADLAKSSAALPKGG